MSCGFGGSLNAHVAQMSALTPLPGLQAGTGERESAAADGGRRIGKRPCALSEQNAEHPRSEGGPR